MKMGGMCSTGDDARDLELIRMGEAVKLKRNLKVV